MRRLALKPNKTQRDTLPRETVDKLITPVINSQIYAYLGERPYTTGQFLSCGMAFNVSLYILDRSPMWAKFLEPLDAAMRSLESGNPNARLIDIMLEVYKFLIEFSPGHLVKAALIDCTQGFRS